MSGLKKDRLVRVCVGTGTFPGPSLKISYLWDGRELAATTTGDPLLGGGVEAGDGWNQAHSTLMFFRDGLNWDRAENRKTASA